MDHSIDYSHDEHPMDRFLCEDTINNAQDATSTSSTGDHATQATNKDFFGQDAANKVQDLSIPDLNLPLVSRLPAFGRLVKRIKKFNVTTEAEFDAFCEVNTIEEHMVLLYAATLETRDLLKGMIKSEGWAMSDELKKSIPAYVKAFLLSPTITSYRGNCATHVYKAMVDLGISDLPSEKNAAQVTEVMSCISGHLTSFRAVIKGKIQASVNPDAKKDMKNVADLSALLISHTRVVPTLQLYIHVAFLRFHVTEYQADPSVDYWAKIDKTLTRWRKGRTAAQLAESFNKMYTEDKVKYGNPADTAHKPVEPKSLPGWLKTVENHAMNVQADSAGASSSKCKRT